MRIDELLVRRGLFSTRQRAKEAIKRGEILVDGRKVLKASEDVSFSSKIEILGDERPKGYWKLKELNEKWNFIKRGDRVLDMGSSAGGFLLYASEMAEFVLGIEYSRDFEGELRRIEDGRTNVRVLFGDVFKIELSLSFDVILNDLTLDPLSSYKALKRFLPLLRPSGFVLFIAKTGISDELPEFELELLRSERAKDKSEIYFLLRKE